MIEIIHFIKDYIVGFLLLISILVFVHEMGHYLVAKLFKVKIESFSIGFGPELFGWTDKSGTRWKISLLPLGGYVKMKGEMIELATDTSQNSLDPEPDAFLAKNLMQRFLIVFAGPFFNLVFPLIILLFISFFVGIPSLSTKLDRILPNDPADNILKSGDVVLRVNEVAVEKFTDMQNIILKNPDENIILKLQRNGSIIDVNVKIGSKEENGKQIGYLGVTADPGTLIYSKYSLYNALDYTYNTYIAVFKLLLGGLAQLFTGKVGLDDIGGPLKIAQISGDSLKQGVGSWLFLMAMLSINLAIINLFPIPALDGGHLLLYIVQGITRKKISPKIQGILMQSGFIFLMLLMGLVIFKDVLSFI
ncbi:RIP metalloprotease RseP [Candidatus Hepatincolaceae symbiont of Richtersius coronifer]